MINRGPYIIQILAIRPTSVYISVNFLSVNYININILYTYIYNIYDVLTA